MTCYTVLDCVLVGDAQEKTYFANLLWVFTQDNPYKVALDTSHRILGIYKKIALDNPGIAVWLDYMSRQPRSFQDINIDTSQIQHDEEAYLMVCKSTRNCHKAIVSSHQRWSYFGYKSDTENIIHYEGTDIKIFDKDEALVDIETSTINITDNSVHLDNSQAAFGGSTMSDNSNTSNKK